MSTVQLTKCDNAGCKSEKKDKDVWLQIGVINWNNGQSEVQPSIFVGDILDVGLDAKKMQFLDLCSSACFHKKIDELLKIPRPGRPVGSKSRTPRKKKNETAPPSEPLLAGVSQ